MNQTNIQQPNQTVPWTLDKITHFGTMSNKADLDYLLFGPVRTRSVHNPGLKHISLTRTQFSPSRLKQFFLSSLLRDHAHDYPRVSRDHWQRETLDHLLKDVRHCPGHALCVALDADLANGFDTTLFIGCHGPIGIPVAEIAAVVYCFL